MNLEVCSSSVRTDSDSLCCCGGNTITDSDQLCLGCRVTKNDRLCLVQTNKEVGVGSQELEGFCGRVDVTTVNTQVILQLQVASHSRVTDDNEVLIEFSGRIKTDRGINTNTTTSSVGRRLISRC